MTYYPTKHTWTSTWTYSFTQLSLFRLCPRRYYERYILPPLEIALQDDVSIQQEYSRTVIHPGIEDFHTKLNSSFDLELSIQTFRGSKVCQNLDTSPWDKTLAESILASYATNPIDDPTHVEDEGRIRIDDTVTGEINKYQFMSKPDFVTETSTADLKFTLTPRPVPLKPFDDQMLGQAIVFGKKKFQRYQIQVDAKTWKLKDIMVEEHPVDDLLRENWFQRTLKSIRDIEECRRVNLWTEHDHSCGAFGKQCPYMGSCVFGRVR